MHDSAPHHQDEDHDDLAALDFAPPPSSEESALHAFDGFGGYAKSADGYDGYDGYDGDGPAVPTFTVTNPPGTVSVTTFVDGRVRHVELSSKVNTLSEVSLADEIVVIAQLATQDARAGQFSFMLEGLRLQGHDGAATRDFLQRNLDLPSPEHAAENRAAVFAQRYAGHHE